MLLAITFIYTYVEMNQNGGIFTLPIYSYSGFHKTLCNNVNTLKVCNISNVQPLFTLDQT